MKTGVDIMAEISKKRFLRSRTPQTTAAEEADTFAELAEFGDGAIFAGRFAGESSWERHPQGDEILQVIEGDVEVRILDESVETIYLSAGMLAVVPGSKWHRLYSANGVTLMTVTPLPTESSASDPQVNGHSGDRV
jgi:mannose-6-phosphate isomerase-like protein (cupin superfamily)